MPLGTVAILSNEVARYARFWVSFCYVDHPGDVHFIPKMGVDIAEARNQALREAQGDWVWFLDDDHTFNRELLRNLLDWNVPVVQPVVLTKYKDFGPVHMGPQDPTTGKYWRYALLPDDPVGLKECHAVGAAGMLVRREVWEAIPEPWFEYGTVNPGTLGEDLAFCRKAREAGFKVYCDLAHPMGHLNVGEIWPERKEDGSWTNVLLFGGQRFEFPATAPKYKVNEEGELVSEWNDSASS